jgi:P-type Mg2+ transporter
MTKNNDTRKMSNNKKFKINSNNNFLTNLCELCSLSKEEALPKLNSRINGLTNSEAEERLEKYGLNIFAKKESYIFLKDMWHRFKNPLIVQLLIICAVSFFIGDTGAVIVVGCMICISVFLGYIQERRSSRASEKLQKLVQVTTIVLRDGKEIQIPINEIVPGDIVALAAGSIVPADIRIIQAKDFFVSQAALTGESMPVEKFATNSNNSSAEPLELSNACFQGSNVISGSAHAVVINTGASTFLGSLSKKLSDRKENTSFDQGIKSFVLLMTRFMLIMVSLTFLIVGFTKHNWINALLFSLSVAVGLTPQMLPMIMTVCLSKGAVVMSKKKVIVKKLKAIQNFGAMNILCTDKTGTLTQNNIILEKYVDVAGRESRNVLEYAYMNSYYQTGLRNLLDEAILAHEDLDVERNCNKIDEIPFDFIRKRMSVIIDSEQQHVLVCKGAVEDIYSICSHYQIDKDIYPLIGIMKDELMEDYRDLSSEGYRILAIAYKEFDRDKKTFSIVDEKDLILLGYVAFLDPPKDSAKKALKSLKTFGVDVKVLTGDNEFVTKKICSDVGIISKKVITGHELSKMDPDTFKNTIINNNAFARLNPTQKEQIIHTLRKMDNVVGFLGDGINDVPAMKAADVSISVDGAVDIAKESADIILLEQSLLVLKNGIIEGRNIFANIIKYIKMGASSNFGNMFSVVGASYFLPFLPMAPIQILTNNLLYDISQTGIPTDNVDIEFIKKPKKWDIDCIKKFMLFIGPTSSIFDYATYFLMLYVFNCILFNSIGIDAASKTYYEHLFQTGWFVESLLTQTLIVHIIRTNKIPFFQSIASTPMILITLTVMIVGIILPYSPLANLLMFVPLPVIYWLWIAGFIISYCILTHAVKVWFIKKYKDIA